VNRWMGHRIGPSSLARTKEGRAWAGLLATPGRNPGQRRRGPSKCPAFPAFDRLCGCTLAIDMQAPCFCRTEPEWFHLPWLNRVLPQRRGPIASHAPRTPPLCTRLQFPPEVPEQMTARLAGTTTGNWAGDDARHPRPPAPRGWPSRSPLRLCPPAHTSSTRRSYSAFR